MKTIDFAVEYLVRCGEPGARVVIRECIDELATLRDKLKEVEGERDEAIANLSGIIEDQRKTLVGSKEYFEAQLTQARADLAEMTEKARKYRVALFKIGCNDIFCAEFERDCGKCQTIAREVVKE